MRKQKVFGTMINLSGEMGIALKELGYIGTHYQFRIVCKCTSMADGNRKCEAVGLGDRVFRSNWCSETGNKRELEICDKTDIAICIDQAGNEYFTIEEIQEKVREIENRIVLSAERSE